MSGLDNSQSLVSQQSQGTISSNPGRTSYGIRRQVRNNQRAIRDQISTLRTDSGIQSAMRQMGSISRKTQERGLASLKDTAAALYREGWSAEAIEQALVDAASRYLNEDDILAAMMEAGLIGGGGLGGETEIPDPTTSLDNISKRLESIKSTLQGLGAK